MCDLAFGWSLTRKSQKGGRSRTPEERGGGAGKRAWCCVTDPREGHASNRTERARGGDGAQGWPRGPGGPWEWGTSVGTRSRSWAAVETERVGSEEGGCDQFCQELCEVGSRAGIDEGAGPLDKKLRVFHAGSVCRQGNRQLYIGERLADQGQLLLGLRPEGRQWACGELPWRSALTSRKQQRVLFSGQEDRRGAISGKGARRNAGV